MTMFLLAKKSTVILIALAISSLSAFPGAFSPSVTAEATQSSAVAYQVSGDDSVRRRANDALGALPLQFEEVRDQANNDVKFIARTAGIDFGIRPTEAVMRLHKKEPRPGSGPGATSLTDSISDVRRSTAIYSASDHGKTGLVRMRLIGANRRARVIGENQRAARTNYFLGRDASHWRIGVANYGRVIVERVYRGIDMVYHGSGHQLEYDFKVAPGANFKAIRLRFGGARSVRLDREGDLLVKTAAGVLRQNKPVAYQIVNGERREVAARYLIYGKGAVGLNCAEYDQSEQLTIDPVLSYATYVGGSGFDEAAAIATDALGNVYVAGSTTSADFPGAGGPRAGGDDVFIFKLDTRTGQLADSAVFGGDLDDAASGIAIDPLGNVYVAGITVSRDFPATTRLTPVLTIEPSDVFVIKLDRSGNLTYSLVFGGSGSDLGSHISVDGSGNAYVAGATDSNDFPVTAGAFQTHRLAPSYDAFLTKVNSEGTTLLYSTYLGGQGDESVRGLVVDKAGDAYLVGTTAPFFRFPTTHGAYRKRIGDAFVVKFDFVGGGLAYSTLLSEPFAAVPSGLALDAAGNAYVIGAATQYFRTTPGAFQPAYKDFGDGFVIKLNSTGSAVVYATLLGGSGVDLLRAIAVDSGGNALITGCTQSEDFPLASPLQTTIGAGRLSSSTDGGRTWSYTQTSLPSGFATALTAEATNARTLYLSIGSGLVKSTDAGSTWAAINNGLPAQSAGSVLIDPRTPATLYVLINGQLFKSTDGGNQWKATGPANLGVSGVILDPRNSAILYGNGAGVKKSTDGGNTWELLSFGDRFVNALAIAASDPAILYAGTETFSQPLYTSAALPEVSDPLPPMFQGISKSTDGGASWSQTAIRTDYVFWINVDPTDATTLYASTPRGLEKSTDGGASWADISAGLPSHQNPALFIDPESPATLYIRLGAIAFRDGISIGGGVYRSTDRGTSWDATPFSKQAVSAFAFVPASPRILYAITDPNGTCFVSKLNASGSALIYSTLLGGNHFDMGTSIAVDQSGNAFVAGYTGSPNFPLVRATQQSLGGSSNAFVAVLSFSPRITSVLLIEKGLIIRGEGFDDNAAALLNGNEVKTTNDAANSTTTLIAKRAAKQIAPGQTVVIQVRNADGAISNEFAFSRSLN